MKHIELLRSVMILWLVSAPVFYCLAGEPNDLFEQWRSEFLAFRESKNKDGLGINHTTDFDKIRNLDSYKALVKSELGNIDTKMLDEMGEYPHTPDQLYLAFVFCERHNWNWRKIVDSYGNRIGKFNLPAIVRIKYREMMIQESRKTNGQNNKGCSQVEERDLGLHP